MKKINLHDYYPSYAKDKIIEVSDEVALSLHEYKRRESAYLLRTYRHRAYFSLDFELETGKGINIIQMEMTPADSVEQQEEKVHLYQALASLPEKQRSRIYAHYFLGMSKAAIAKAEGCNVNSVKESIYRGLQNLKKYFENFS